MHVYRGTACILKLSLKLIIYTLFQSCIIQGEPYTLLYSCIPCSKVCCSSLIALCKYIMSQLNDDLEHLELDYLRHQALSSMTPKVFYLISFILHCHMLFVSTCTSRLLFIVFVCSLLFIPRCDTYSYHSQSITFDRITYFSDRSKTIDDVCYYAKRGLKWTQVKVLLLSNVEILRAETITCRTSLAIQVITNLNCRIPSFQMLVPKLGALVVL